MADVRILTRDLKVIIDDHLQRHDDKYDPMLNRHDRLLYGEHGDDGMVLANKEIQIALKSINEKLDRKEENNKWMTRLIAGTLITSILTAIMTLILR